MEFKRGDIYYVDFGSNTNFREQCGMRPVVILQNNIGNKYSPTTIVAPLTTKKKEKRLPVHIVVEKDEENNLKENSILLLEQIQIIDKKRLFKKMGKITNSILEKVNKGIMISLEIGG